MVCRVSVLQIVVQFDSRISNAEAFVEKLREDTDKDIIRGPYLATLEIERKKHLQGKGDSDKLSEFLVQYIVRYHRSFRPLLSEMRSKLQFLVILTYFMLIHHIGCF